MEEGHLESFIEKEVVNFKIENYSDRKRHFIKII